MPVSSAHIEMVRRLPLAIPEVVLAEHFEVSLKTWQAMRQRGEGPPWVEAGHRVIYIRDCVLLWLDKRITENGNGFSSESCRAAAHSWAGG